MGLPPLSFKREKDFGKIQFFLNHNFSSPTHYPSWNVLVGKYFHTDFFYYTCYAGDELIGICPVHKYKSNYLVTLETGPKQYLLPYGGWIFSGRININLADLDLGYNENFTGFSLPNLEEFNVGYTSGKAQLFSTLIVDLRKTEEEIWNNDITSTRRNMIRKAEKNDVKIEELNLNDFDLFYSLLKEANSLYGLNTLEKKYYAELFSSSVDIYFKIYVAKQGSGILGGVVIALCKDYSIYWLGIKREDKLNLGQGELLQWHTIKEMKKNGCRYYDLCYIEKERLPHIYRFKSDFSKYEVSVTGLSQRKISYKILRRLIK